MTGHPDLSSARSSADQPHRVLFLLDAALNARAELFDSEHLVAFRLFSGFYEGSPHLVIDIYSRTLVIYNYADNPAELLPIIQVIKPYLLERYTWIQTIILKTRSTSYAGEKRGKIIHGDTPDSRLKENNVWYALDLTINQDASFYPDARNLRLWVKENLDGRSVLNTFAYTGSLGVAARAGGALKVVYLDISRKYLNLAKSSYTLNGFTIDEKDFLVGDFWVMTNRLKRSGALFDCVLIDPPFFAKTGRGTVDLNQRSQRLINKVRPLVSHGGYLVVVNNALYVSGKDFMNTLEELCSSGYLLLESLIPIPQDITGYPQTQVNSAPVDPAPFNHSTKIAILRVFRKDKRI